MTADGFDTLATHFTDRTVVTYDPRGQSRSVRTDGRSDHTPQHQTDDLHLLIERSTPVRSTCSRAAAVR
jgi:hypothetical protein